MALEATVSARSKVVIATGCHRSIEDSLFLKCLQGSDLKIVYLATQWSAPSETYLPATAKDVEPVVKQHADADLVALTSPTYPGIVPLDLADSVQIIRRHAPRRRSCLTAWGTHFGISPRLPSFGARFGADIITTSDHKSWLADEQVAMLYLNSHDKRLADRVDRAFGVVCSTSPSHRLVASADASVQAACRAGSRLIDDALAFAEEFRKAVSGVRGLRTLGISELAGYAEFYARPWKVFVDVSATGFTGHQVFSVLQTQERIVPEMATARGVLFLINPAYPVEKVADCVARIRGVLEVNKPVGITGPVTGPPLLRLEILPTAALQCEPEYCALRDAEHRIAAREVCWVILPGSMCSAPGNGLTMRPSNISRTVRKQSAKVQGMRANKLAVVPLE